MSPLWVAFQALTMLQMLSGTAAQLMQPFPMSHHMVMPQPMGMPQPIPMSMPGPPVPMQSPMLPVPMPMPQARLPVVVMPYYSKSADKRAKPKKRKHRKKTHKRYSSSDTSSDTSSDDSESYSSEYRRSGKSSNMKKSGGKNRHQVLTPVISYMTKDGYVVYQKKIKKETARDWLSLGHQKEAPRGDNEWHDDSDEMTVAQLKGNLRKVNRNDHNDD